MYLRLYDNIKAVVCCFLVPCSSLRLCLLPAGKIKELLMVEIRVPTDKMQLCGWVHKTDATITDQVWRSKIVI